MEDDLIILKEEQRLEAAQMKFLRHLLGITKLDKEKNQCIRQKNGSTEHNKGNSTVPEKVATICTEDGHKQTTKTRAQNIVKEIKQYQKSGYNMYRGWTQIEYQNKHYNINQKDEGI